MYDLVAIGDATLDVFMQIDDANVMCELDNVNCKLCLNYADKIAAKTADFIIGGNAANAAVGTRRLGASSAMLTTVGQDETGKQIQAVFRKEGVSTEYLTVDPNGISNYSVVINFHAERTILVHHVPRTYVWNIKERPKWFYVTSMGEGFEAVYQKVMEMVHQGNIFMAYNPGTHQLNKGLEFLQPSVAVATLLFLNRQETARLLGIKDQSSIVDMLKGLKKLGPQIVVITDGPEGSYAYDGKTMYYLKLFDGPVVERTGCGDAYATAFTNAFAEGKPITECMLWGNANATSVLAYVGPEAGLLTKEGVEQLIAKNSSIQPIVLLEEEQNAVQNVVA